MQLPGTSTGRGPSRKGFEPETIPATFSQTAAVPGLIEPSPPRLSRRRPVRDARVCLYHEAGTGSSRPRRTAKVWAARGRLCQLLWTRARSRCLPGGDHATLVVNKAQFGTAMWLNGKKVGEHLGCFTAGRFDVTTALNWGGENRLVIRIGAHPGAMPDWAFWGSDGEKGPWTPGIYDRVELLLADNPVIESVQVVASGSLLGRPRANFCITNYADAAYGGPDPAGSGRGRTVTWSAVPCDSRCRLVAGEEKRQ